MGIRIDPALEFVWRDPHTVQLGVDPVRAVVPVPTLGEERFLVALRSETAREALGAVADQAGCPPASAAAVLDAASPTVLDVLPEPAARVELLGDGPVPDLVAELLVDLGITIVRTVAVRGGPVPLPEAPPRVAVAVTAHVLDPAIRAAWARRGTPHLAVVIGDGRIRIGPLVEDGRGPCLQCAEYARTDDDPHWPTVVAQVWGRRVAPLSRYGAAVVATRVVALVLARLPFVGGVGDGVQEIVDRADLTITRRTLVPHPRCACRGLRGNDSRPDRPLATIPGATT